MASVTPKIRSPQGRRGDPARRLRQAPAQRDAGLASRSSRGPTRRVAAALEVPEERVLARVGELRRRAHHPPGHADLRHPRARLRLDARRGQGRPRAPVARRAGSSTRTPASATTTCATTSSTCGSRSPSRRTPRSACEGTLDVLQELTGAESIRQLPTLKLFKIRMDLELVGGTDELAKSAVAEEPIELEKQPYDELDRAVIRATQGDLPIVAEPYAAAAARAGHERRRAGRAPARDGRPRPAAPRRRDPLPPPRRLQRQRHGRLAGPRRAHRRGRPADGRLPRHLALLPAPDLRRLALLDLHHGPRALQGGVRRDPRRDRRRRTRRSRTARRSTARPSSRRSASCTSPTTSRPGNASTRGV